ncbi:hypothetical protein NDU88_007322 [Pleurodeles waltl]|uniref:Uncharacterized protein n=1 Tax=Pleurodeles waltl TaxID=8319 RepID=A0AAV7RPY9_PLEWA|nr:hypothetical protein NDU88_007322 [Pleurodeles waltl]
MTLRNTEMGKTDKMQGILHFEQHKTPMSRERCTNDVGATLGELESDMEPEQKHILTAMQQSLATIDGKIDSLSFRMDRISEHLDKNAERLDTAECRISEDEDDYNTVASAQSKMDTTAAVLQAKVQDLKVLSRRSNIRVVGIAESTAIDNMEHYIEQLLVMLLERGSFSDIFVVKQPHC